MNLRLNTKDVTESPCLVPVLLVRLAERVDVVHTHHPFVLGKFDLTTKVVNVLDERAKNFPVSRLGFRAHQINDTLCEVRVELALGTAVGSGPVDIGLDSGRLDTAALEDSLADR